MPENALHPAEAKACPRPPPPSTNKAITQLAPANTTRRNFDITPQIAILSCRAIRPPQAEPHNNNHGRDAKSARPFSARILVRFCQPIGRSAGDLVIGGFGRPPIFMRALRKLSLKTPIYASNLHRQCRAGNRTFCRSVRYGTAIAHFAANVA